VSGGEVTDAFKKIIIQYCRIDPKVDENWNFNWYKTACNSYNPREKVYDETKEEGKKGCGESELCKIRVEASSKRKYANCDTWKSFKISIENENNFDILSDYISFIKTCNDPSFNRVVLEDCEDFRVFNRKI
jgi:hypothetical protein